MPPAPACVDRADFPPASRIVACTLTIDGKTLMGSELAAAHLIRGQAYRAVGDQARAFADYSRALSIDPKYVDALVNRAAIYSMQGSTGKTLADLDQAVELQPNHALAHYNRGYAHFARRDYEQAITDYTLAIEADARMSWAFNNRCLTRMIVSRDLVEALSDCDEALKLQPDNAETRETRGIVFLKLGEKEIALREYDAALRSDPDRPVALYGRGLARVAKGEVRNGESDKAAARALLPDIARQFAMYGLH